MNLRVFYLYKTVGFGWLPLLYAIHRAFPGAKLFAQQPAEFFYLR